MYRIKRTKKPPAPSELPPTTHYATGVAPAGNITGWTADVEQAAAFDDATVVKVKAYYRSRENVGELKFESDRPEPAKPMPEKSRTVPGVPAK